MKGKGWGLVVKSDAPARRCPIRERVVRPAGRLEATSGGCIEIDEPIYQLRRDVTRPQGSPNLLDVTGVNGLAQAAGIASFWIRKGIADHVEVLNRQRVVLAIARFDVRVLEEPRRQDTYQVRTLDQRQALICLGGAARLRDALILADEQMLSPSAPATVEVRRGRSTVALLTRADMGRVWPGRMARMCIGDADFTRDEPRPWSFD